jgi:hypothetical protein
LAQVIVGFAMGRRAFARRPIVRFALMLIAAGVGCSSFGPPQPPAPQSQRNILTREEILASTAYQGDLLDAIHGLRPTFLARPRGVYAGNAAAAVPLAVYVDRIRQSGIESLRSIAAGKVAEVRYLDPTASLNEFGPTASGGSLHVRMFDPSTKVPTPSSDRRPHSER